MEGKVLLQDLAQKIADKRNMQRKDVEIFLKAFFDTICDGILQDKIVKIKGLGTFKMIDVQDRESVNVNTGERIVIPGHSKISFTPDTELKDEVNKPFALFQTVVINDGTSIDDMEKIDKVAPVISLEEDITKESFHDETEENKEAPQQNEFSEELISIGVPISTAESGEKTVLVTETEDEPVEPINHVVDTECKKHRWWYIGPAMTALLFAFFWIVFLIGYFVGRNNWSFLDGLINRDIHEPIVKIDTFYVEKNVEFDSTYIHSLEDSLRNAVQEINNIKKELTKTSTSKSLTVESRPVVANAKKTASYEIVGFKGVRIIKWGDYLLKIVRQEYGNDDALKYVILYNNFKDPNNLPIGTEIKLPKLKEK